MPIAKVYDGSILVAKINNFRIRQDKGQLVSYVIRVILNLRRACIPSQLKFLTISSDDKSTTHVRTQLSFL